MDLASKERENYLAKALEAEIMAAQFSDDTYFRTSWLHIAQGYREMLEAPEPSAVSDTPKP